MADPTPRPTPDLSRRRFLQGTALAGVATFLAACGTKGTSSTAPSAAPSTAPASTAPASASASAAPSAPAPSALANVGGTLNFANWIGYIDVDDSGAKHPTLDKFTKEQGTKVNYVEAIDGNEEFYAKIQGQLSAGLPTEWDLMVVTDWMVARLVRLGWLDEIDKSQTPNFPANLLESYIGRSFDPDTKFAAPWQSGMTGLGFDKKKTGALDSLEILFTDKYKGKITYLTEMRDTVGLSAIRLGSDPGTLTQEQFDAALAEVDKAVKAGIVRQVVGNSYVDVMAGGDAVLAMAWSGDVLTLLVPDQKPTQDFQWALPKEGGMLWTDNMCIPKGAKNKTQAVSFINFYYDPVNAATIEAYVNYVCPVKGAKDEMLKIDKDIANNPLIFPPDATLALLKQFRAVTAEEEQAWAEAFNKVLGL
ncbi:MAG TPA: extracellular solute-binding protein [Verrucomicrobiae bacterium]|jgi:spermidine/putrescine transport system substrate-binding protein|nr:extracellular solute-binding protein [Verrucomicrobiae bacterium]